MRALLAAIAALLVAAPAAGAQDAVERAAEALRSEPVYVDPAAEALSPAAADALRDRVAGEDVWIAVLPRTAADQPREAQELIDAVDRPGAYGIFAGGRLWTGGTGDTAEARAAALDSYDGGGAAELLTEYVDELAAADEGAGGGAGGLILLGLAGAGGAAVLVGRRRRRRERAAEFAEVKDNARDDLVALGDDIRALDLDVELETAAREDYANAVAAYERADDAWKRARTPEDLEPVGAALEEGRYAMLAAKARLEGREPPERRSPCFFDPRHGPSSREVEWAPLHGEPRMVPACEADAQRVERGDDPEAREVLVRGQRVPYWNAGPMYAPFAGGFYGAGVFPGLMIGTLLGGSMGWGAGAAHGAFGGGDFGGGDLGGGFGGGDFGGGFGGGDFGG